MFRNGKKLGAWTLKGEGPIGRGGNGVVWRAVNADGEAAAVKILLPRAYSSERRYERFRREVDTQRLLTAEGVAGVLPLLDADCPDEPSNANPPWLATSIATPLTAYRDERETTLRECVEIVADLGESLLFIHKRIGAHRDIKLDNIFHYDGAWRFGDFGLINVAAETRLTAEGERIGAAFYCAPEMLNEASQYDGVAGDVYSLAKVLWTLGAKQKYPLQGVLERHVPGFRLSTYCAELEAVALDALLATATLAQPEDRPGLQEFVSELRTWLQPAGEMTQTSSLKGLRKSIITLTGDIQAKQEARVQEYQRVTNAQRRLLNQFGPTLQKILDEWRGAGLTVTNQRHYPEGNKAGNLVAALIENNPEAADGVVSKPPSLNGQGRDAHYGLPGCFDHAIEGHALMQHNAGGREFNYQIQCAVGIVQPRYEMPEYAFIVKLSDKALLCAGYSCRLNSDRREECTGFLPLIVYGRQIRFGQPSEEDAIGYLSACLLNDLGRATSDVIERYQHYAQQIAS